MEIDSFDSFISKNRKCSYCGASVRQEQKYCTECGKLCSVNGWEECGKDRCGNCHSPLYKGDRYCRICGTKAGEGAYEPFMDIMECIYGPAPAERTHQCKQCGYKWTTIQMIDRQKFCPQCGGEAPYPSFNQFVYED